MQFEWNKEKAAANFSKHGVTFEEAATVWDDYFNIELFDSTHSEEEKRLLMVGESSEHRLLIISFTERGNSVRIISARELTPKERREYDHGHFE